MLRREEFVSRLEARGTYPTWVLVAALAGTFATTFPITILAVTLAPIAGEFGVRETTVAWVISAPLLLSAVTLPLLGKLGDLYGHRRVFLGGFAAATVTAVATAFAWDVFSLIGLRSLAAVVGGATQPTAMALILSVHRHEERVRAMGWWSMTAAAAPAVGLIAGGPLVDLVGWRVVFVLQAFFSLFALAMATFVLRETKRQHVRFDIAGAVTLAVGVGGLMFALGTVRDAGLLAPQIWSATAVGLVGLAAFAAVERRAHSPLFPLEFFARRAFTAPIVSNTFNSGAYMGAFVVAPLLFIEIFGYSITQTSAIMLVRTVSLTVASPVGGRLGGRIGERAAAVIGSTVMTLSLALIAWGSLTRSLPLLVGGLVLQGWGHGLSIPSLASATASAVPDHHLGIAAATNRLTSQVGVAFGITVLTMAYGGVHTAQAFSTAFLVGAALALIALASAAAMRGGRMQFGK